MKRTNILLLILLISPVFLTAQQPRVVLGWTPNSEQHLSHYNVYRDNIPGTMVYLDVISKYDSIYSDFQVEIGQTYYYKLTAVDSFGNESGPSSEVMALVGVTGLGEGKDANNPTEFELQQNYPNPFNPVTRIGYNLPHSGKVQIIIFDVLGRVVRTLVDGDLPAGHHEALWDGQDEAGKPVAGGIYFYQMTARSYQEVKKLLYQK